jgi:hypothetical protein
LENTVYIKTFLNCAALSVGLISSAGAMKIGEHFEIDVIAKLGEMSFPSPVLSFPKGNQMGPQDVFAQLSQLSEKMYDAALNTGNANYVYKQNNKAQFHQNIKIWLQNFAQFTFSDNEGYKSEALIMHRNKDCFWEDKNIVLKEFCALRTADPKTSAADDIILVARIKCFND